ncbi:hypothetical protein NXW13_07185 [Bacteroides thetaiotaomicron]|nr:hypothetical protein [Bacteroides thetaiotaomicron]
MDNRACKGQISRIFASLFPNYGRKSYDYGEISTLLWGRATGKHLMEMPRKSQENSHTMG